MLMVKGPTKIPIGPNSEIPPKTENKIKKGGKFILLPTINGLNKLSIIPTTATAQTKSPMASKVFPVIKRNIMAGTEIIAVPIEGTNAVIMVTNPQSAEFGTPKIARPTPINIPWIRAIKRYPLIMPLTARESLFMIFSSSVSESGLNMTNAFLQCAPSFKK